MAKIALCGYGRDGRGTGTTIDGYAYVVNNNVNVGDRLQVIATSRKGNKFVTTASPNRVLREDTVEGKFEKSYAERDMQLRNKDNPTASKIENAYTGKELGVKGFKGSPTYQEQTRANALQQYAQTHPNETYSKNAEKLIEKGTYESFDDYSKRIMGDNK